jgi:Acetyl-coenzyme A synthetase N-terminus
MDWSQAPFAKWFVGGKLNVAYNFVDGHGCGDECTQHANVEAFSHYAIVPRMLVGAAERDLPVP